MSEANKVKLYQYLDVPVPVGWEVVEKLVEALNTSKCADDIGAYFLVHTLALKEAMGYLEQVMGLMKGDSIE